MKPLEDVRIVARRAVRRRPVRQRAPGRSRRRGDQDRGPAGGRRRRSLRAAVRRGRGLAVLRDLQPQQAQPLARPRRPRRAARSSRTWSAVSRRRLLQPARRRARRRCASATTTSSTSTRASCACSLTGFGMTGPRSAEPGYDYVLQGLAGWMELTGEPDGPPTKSGLSLVDYSGGFVAALVAARRRARRPPRRRRHGLRRQPLRHRDRRC